MTVRLRLLALALPIAVAGILAAHAVGYRLAEPHASEREALLAASGHGYLAQAWLALLAVLALGLGIELVLGFVHGPLAARLPRSPFLLLAPGAYLLQEHGERLLAGAGVGSTLAEPAVLAGLALQLPFALATWLLAGLVLRVSETLVAASRASARPLADRFTRARRRPPTRSLDPERLLFLAGTGARAPPPLAPIP
ncbi:MAG: hypothetical protein RMM28_06790 [Thermoleophilia bacterium]|nr:hypothetical protein [Gaiellaceae bacterium]MDW8338825.1 hypothetical protein [Thermoleophilia bacterium]